jgi:ubiquinone/menaquinone biosynthesis C-methylase UbiE
MKTELQQQEIDLQDRVAAHYEGDRYQAPHARRYHIWWVNEMLRGTPDTGLWLELGCGTGWVHEVLRGQGSRRQLIGLDISRGMLRHARRKQMRVLCGDAVQLPFADQSFDGVLAKGVLHHIPAMAAAVAEIARVLKPGGVATLAEPNLSPLRALRYTLRHRDEHFSALHRALRPAMCRRMVAGRLRIIRFRFFGLLAYAAAFPDILPLKVTTGQMDGLIRLDELLARVPFLNQFCWAFSLTARKEGEGEGDA